MTLKREDVEFQVKLRGVFYLVRVTAALVGSYGGRILLMPRILLIMVVDILGHLPTDTSIPEVFRFHLPRFFLENMARVFLGSEGRYSLLRVCADLSEGGHAQ